MASKTNDTSTTVGSGTFWSNPSYCVVLDGSASGISATPPGVPPNPLVISTCRLAIPAGATIDGFKVTVTKNYSSSGTAAIVDDTVKITLHGGTNSSNYADTSTNWVKGTFTDSVYGGSSDLWGLTSPSVSDVNGDNFKVSCKPNFSSGSFSFANIDQIKIEVFYTPGSGSPSAMIFHAF